MRCISTSTSWRLLVRWFLYGIVTVVVLHTILWSVSVRDGGIADVVSARATHQVLSSGDAGGDRSDGVASPQPLIAANLPDDTTLSSSPIERSRFLLPHDARRTPPTEGVGRTGRGGTPFHTVYHKTHCGAVVRNACFIAGQPRYFTPTGALLTRSGATTVCNEAVRKSKLHMVVRAVGNSTQFSAPLSVRVRQILVVPFCWELYGYHLFLCLLSAWANLCRLGRCIAGLREGDEVPGGALPASLSGVSELLQGSVIRVGFLKGSGLFPYLRGSDRDWNSASLPLHTPAGRTVEKARYTPYWPMWRVLVDAPDLVSPLPDVDDSCYPAAVFGHVPSYDVTPIEQQKFREAVLQRVLPHESNAPQTRPNTPFLFYPRQAHFVERCGPGRRFEGEASVVTAAGGVLTLRVALVQRRERYRIVNLDDVVSALHRGLKGTHRPWNVSVSVLVLEDLSLTDQLRLAAVEVDVLVGVHGNALSWSMFLESTAVVIELWPNVPYNNNYEMFCWRGNLLHLSVRGEGSCKARCSAVYPAAHVESAANAAAEHLERVRCGGGNFNSTAKFFAAKREAALRKVQKMHAEHGVA